MSFVVRRSDSHDDSEPFTLASLEQKGSPGLELGAAPFAKDRVPVVERQTTRGTEAGWPGG